MTPKEQQFPPNKIQQKNAHNLYTNIRKIIDIWVNSQIFKFVAFTGEQAKKIPQKNGDILLKSVLLPP